MLPSLAISKALHDTDIVAYLQSLGISPESENHGRLKYCCPIHKEADPSFVLYPATESEPQNFFCYGCKAGGNIINLKAALENRSYGAALRSIVSDINIDDKEALDYAVEQMRKAEKSSAGQTPEDLSMMVGVLFRSFCDSVNHAPEYVSKAEQAMQLFDYYVMRYDMSKADEVYNDLVDIFIRLANEYAENKEKQLLSATAVYAKMR